MHRLPARGLPAQRAVHVEAFSAPAASPMVRRALSGGTLPSEFGAHGLFQGGFARRATQGRERSARRIQRATGSKIVARRGQPPMARHVAASPSRSPSRRGAARGRRMSCAGDIAPAHRLLPAAVVQRGVELFSRFELIGPRRAVAAAGSATGPVPATSRPPAETTSSSRACVFSRSARSRPRQTRPPASALPDQRHRHQFAYGIGHGCVDVRARSSPRQGRHRIVELAAIGEHARLAMKARKPSRWRCRRRAAGCCWPRRRYPGG